MKSQFYMEFTRLDPSACPGACDEITYLSLRIARIGTKPCKSGYAAERSYRFGKRRVLWGRFGSNTPAAWFCRGSKAHRVLIVAEGVSVKDHGPRPQALARFAASARPARSNN
jgi:hypothetical protein